MLIVPKSLKKSYYFLFPSLLLAKDFKPLKWKLQNYTVNFKCQFICKQKTKEKIVKSKIQGLTDWLYFNFILFFTVFCLYKKVSKVSFGSYSFKSPLINLILLALIFISFYSSLQFSMRIYEGRWRLLGWLGVSYVDFEA